MSEAVHLTLRLEPGAGTPRGEVVMDGSARRFYGWLELLRCLEEARVTRESHHDGGDCDG